MRKSALERLCPSISTDTEADRRVREAYPDLPIVGFKAETSGDDAAMIAEAERIRDRVGLSFVVANDASVMGADETRVLLVGDDEVEPEEATGSKDAVAGRIADRLAASIGVEN